METTEQKMIDASLEMARETMSQYNGMYEILHGEHILDLDGVNGNADVPSIEDIMEYLIADVEGEFCGLSPRKFDYFFTYVEYVDYNKMEFYYNGMFKKECDFYNQFKIVKANNTVYKFYFQEMKKQAYEMADCELQSMVDASSLGDFLEDWLIPLGPNLNANDVDNSNFNNLKLKKDLRVEDYLYFVKFRLNLDDDEELSFFTWKKIDGFEFHNGYKNKTEFNNDVKFYKANGTYFEY